MEVFMDDHQIEGDFAAECTVGEALRQVQSTIHTPGRIVVGLRCDGENVPTNDMGSTLAKATSDFERLDVVTGTRQSLVLDAMTQASAALDETGDQCQQVADLLTEGNTAEGVKTLGECLGVWRQVHDAVNQSLQLLKIDPEAMKFDDDQLATLISGPKDILLQVKQALESKDHVLLADIMQYEFESVTRQWQDLIGVIRQRAEDFEETPAETS